MSTPFNPFARTKLKIVEPLQLVNHSYDGWGEKHTIEYRASRGAANAGLLGKQFAIGKPLVVNGRHVVVESADMTVTNSSIDEITIRVQAVDFAAVLKRATSPANPEATIRVFQNSALAKPKAAAPFGAPKRRILS